MRTIRAKVPGKVMLAGEYAVLEGGRCLAVAVDRWLEVQAQESTGYEIHSDLWSSPLTLDLSSKDSTEPLIQTALLAKHLWFQDRGFSLLVRSDLPISFGLGSSSAVRLASLLALARLAGEELDLDQTGRMVRELQMHQQSFASGYDVLTQSRGGLLLWTPDYKNWPGTTQSFASEGLHPWLHIYAGGRGAPTTQQGTSFRQWLKDSKQTAQLNALSEGLIDGFLHIFKQGWSASKIDFLERLIPHRRLFQAAPGFPHALAERLAQVPGFDQEWSFKTTGAGGEDAIILFGQHDSIQLAHDTLISLGWSRLDVPFSEQGARCEDIQ